MIQYNDNKCQMAMARLKLIANSRPTCRRPPNAFRCSSLCSYSLNKQQKWKKHAKQMQPLTKCSTPAWGVKHSCISSPADPRSESVDAMCVVVCDLELQFAVQGYG